jgi:bcr-type benzoyl-CoA reductase subunit C
MPVETFRQILDEFVAVEADPYRRILEAKTSRGGPVVAYLPPDVPEELIHAAGALPFAIFGGSREQPVVSSAVPSFICPTVRLALGKAARGDLSFAEGVVLPYICDSTKSLSQVWRPHAVSAFTHALCFPKDPDHEGARAFLVAEFLRLKERLENLTGKRVSEDALRESIRVHNENRRLLRKLAEAVHVGQLDLSLLDYYAVVRSSMLIPKEEHTARLSHLLERAVSKPAGDRDGVRIFLYGYWAEPRSLFSDLERAGMRVVADNLHDGTRFFDIDAEETEAPLEALARRQLQRTPMGCFHHASGQLRHYLDAEVKRNRVEGVVHVAPARCDTMQFDLPAIRRILQDLEVPVLTLETEFDDALDGQARTRVEAFGEILRGRRDGLDS